MNSSIISICSSHALHLSYSRFASQNKHSQDARPHLGSHRKLQTQYVPGWPGEATHMQSPCFLVDRITRQHPDASRTARAGSWLPRRFRACSCHCKRNFLSCFSRGASCMDMAASSRRSLAPRPRLARPQALRTLRSQCCHFITMIGKRTPEFTYYGAHGLLLAAVGLSHMASGNGTGCLRFARSLDSHTDNGVRPDPRHVRA